ncbi:MAG: diacylglycerol kinase [Cytophagales bacterium]|nr:MAG: diacylglycerol kinase [Cytophagales bacterium]
MAHQPGLLAIINPLSGTATPAQKEQLRHYLTQKAQAAGYAAEIVVTTHAGHATELATEAVRLGIGRVLAIGGDGTINETARALRQSSSALGIVPMGSGNGLARHLGVPLNAKLAIEKALSGRPVLIDSGEIGEHPFFCTAGFGFEANVAHVFAQQPVRGLSTYARMAYRAFWNYQPSLYRINGEEKRLFSLTFANAGQFGNNAWIAPTANIADGRLDQCALVPFPKSAGGGLVWRLFNKSLDRSTYWQSSLITKATVETNGPLLIHADGEPLTLAQSCCDVRVLPESLLVLL